QPEFAKLFSRVLSQYDVSTIPASSDSVSAGEVDRMRRRHIKHLIFLGASDDRIPAVSAAGGILSDDERDELREYGLDLGGSDDRLKREFSLIYNCVTLPGETLTISYCTADGSGAKTRPSFLIKRASMLFRIEPENFDIVKARLCTEDTAFLLAAQGNTLARTYFAANEHGAKRLRELDVRRDCGLGGLSPESAQALYGKVKTLSPSQTESFSGCRLSYFLRYGLRLDEKKQSGFTPPELGTFMHYVLENTVREIAAGVGFEAADEAEVFASADKYISNYVSERLGGFEDKSPRFVYLFDRMRPAVRRVTLDTVRELGRSDFRPLDFELKFMRDGDLPPIDIAGAAARIVGIADRVDGYERNGKLYVRVVDYKTGKKAFSLSDIYNGMGLQMLIYLFALETEGGRRYGREIVPAGVAYVPAKDITVSVSADLPEEELASKRTKALKRSGLFLHDEAVLSAMEHGDSCEYLPVSRNKNGELTGDSLASAEQFGKLKDFVSNKLTDLSEQLSGGSIDAEPYYRSETDNACRNCPYAKVCRFDDATGKRRYLSKIKPEQFWAMLGGDSHE
ncbi:MAG: ATP-dependent nuclease subunit B, partial [Clostridia bacterium]|nr:ATP-dependent nuclease subunit B [Clostridia bacterium]